MANATKAATLTRGGELTFLSFPIEKTETDPDTGDVIVYGKATDGSLDSDEQIIDPDFAAKAIQDWLQDGANIRVQHNPQRDPAGVGIEADTDPMGATWVKGRIVEPVAQKLVNAGALRAYSVGIARPKIERDSAARGGRITGGQVVEISLVDRPANKNCSIQLVKASKNGKPKRSDAISGDRDFIAKYAGNSSDFTTKAGPKGYVHGWVKVDVGGIDATPPEHTKRLAKVLNRESKRGDISGSVANSYDTAASHLKGAANALKNGDPVGGGAHLRAALKAIPLSGGSVAGNNARAEVSQLLDHVTTGSALKSYDAGSDFAAKVGPHGYVHGWIKVDPGSSDHSAELRDVARRAHAEAGRNYMSLADSKEGILSERAARLRAGLSDEDIPESRLSDASNALNRAADMIDRGQPSLARVHASTIRSAAADEENPDLKHALNGAADSLDELPAGQGLAAQPPETPEFQARTAAAQAYAQRTSKGEGMPAATAEKMVTLELPENVSVAFTPADLQRIIQKKKSSNIGEDTHPGGVDRSKIPDEDFAGKDRSFPITSPGDVADAAQSIGRAGPDNYSHEKLKENIKRIARRKGQDYVDQLPDSWKQEDAAAEKRMAREYLIVKYNWLPSQLNELDDQAVVDLYFATKAAEADLMKAVCTLCHGTGKIREGHVTCPRCHGDGKMSAGEPDEHGDFNPDAGGDDDDDDDDTVKKSKKKKKSYDSAGADDEDGTDDEDEDEDEDEDDGVTSDDTAKKANKNSKKNGKHTSPANATTAAGDGSEVAAPGKPKKVKTPKHQVTIMTSSDDGDKGADGKPGKPSHHVTIMVSDNPDEPDDGNVEKSKKMACKCGTMVKGKAKFCPSCGARLSGPDTDMPDKTGVKKADGKPAKAGKPTKVVVDGPGDKDHDGDGLFDADGDGDGAVATLPKNGKPGVTKAGARSCKNCGKSYHADSKRRKCKNCGEKLPPKPDVTKGVSPQVDSPSPGDGAKGEHTKPMPPHREPDGAEVEAYEKDMHAEDGDQDSPVEQPTHLEEPTLKSDASSRALERILKRGVPRHLGVIHDMTCPAFRSSVISKCYPDRSLATEVNVEEFQGKALDLAAKLPYHKAAQASLLGSYASILKQADEAVIREVRDELHKMFADANPGPGTAPTPSSDITPGSYNRPYLSAGHAAPSPQHGPPNSTPLVSDSINAEEFDRPPLIVGHEAPSPGNGPMAGMMSHAVNNALQQVTMANDFVAGLRATGGTIPGSVPVPITPMGLNMGLGGVPNVTAVTKNRTFYSHASKDQVHQAMQGIHDHVASVFPDICPMKHDEDEEEPAAAKKQLASSTSQRVKSISKAGKKSRKRDKKLEKAEKRLMKEAALALATLPSDDGMVTKSAASDVVTNQLTEVTELLEKMSAQIAERDEMIVKQQKKLKKAQKDIDNLASQPDPNVVGLRGALLSPPPYLAKQQNFQPAVPAPDMADVQNRTKAMMLGELEQQFRTSPDPAQREAAWKSILAMRGLAS